MRSFLGRLLVSALVRFTPLTAAVTGRKKTTRKKVKASKPVAAREARAGRSARAGKESPRAAKASRPAPARAPKGARRSGPRQKEQPAPTAKTDAARAAREARAETLPKPVAPVGRALLLAPENGKYADTIHPKFRWLSVGGANRYEVAWSERPDFSDPHSVMSIATEAVVPVEKALRVNATYYWRVRGGNEGGWGPWSPAASFQVLEEPPAP